MNSSTKDIVTSCVKRLIRNRASNLREKNLRQYAEITYIIPPSSFSDEYFFHYLHRRAYQGYVKILGVNCVVTFRYSKKENNSMVLTINPE